jgi:hypothetical protein
VAARCKIEDSSATDDLDHAHCTQVRLAVSDDPPLLCPVGTSIPWRNGIRFLLRARPVSRIPYWISVSYHKRETSIPT